MDADAPGHPADFRRLVVRPDSVFDACPERRNLRERARFAWLFTKENLMKFGMFTLAMLLAGTAAAGAQASSTKQTPPGPVGADSNIYNQGIARDPGEVQAQQGGSTKASPGTVGAAPGADTNSQRSKP